MEDITQFETFVKNYQDMVFSVAVRLLANETDAQDISQIVFLKAYENFTWLPNSPSAGGWLKTVTTNLCLNHLTRYRARWRFFSEMRKEDDETEYVDTLSAPDSLESNLAGSDYRAVIEQVIQKLPHAQRIALVLYHFEDQSYEEIAKKLGISLSKVKTDIHRARLTLKRYLRPEMLDFASEDEMGKESRDRQAEPPGNSALAEFAARARKRLRTFPALSPIALSHGT